MRILLDTNIFIAREADRVISSDLTSLLGIFNKLKTECLVHPLSITELKNDKDEKRREINLSKIRTYQVLENPPNPETDRNYVSSIGEPRSDHDRIDNAILFCIYRNAVDFLITEDREIHKKAQKLGLGDRVFLVGEALSFFKKQIPSAEKISTPPALVHDYVYNLKIEDTIFQSLISDYPDFRQWFERISREGRRCYVHKRSDGTIGALLIYKIEDEPIPSVPPLPKKKRLKIATLKVTHMGYKIGELLIKISIDLALHHGIDEIYLTHFIEPEDRLVDVIQDFGFFQAAYLPGQRQESVFIKYLKLTEPWESLTKPVEISRISYPSFYDGESVDKFIIPIQPEYHEKLFTDFRERRQSLLPEYLGEFVTEGNTIKKAYLTHSKIRKLKPGDIVLFYRSKDLQAITSLGVVDQFNPDTAPGEIMRIIGKRSVYSKDDIERSNKNWSIILFRHHFHLKESISLDTLRREGILKEAPQSITEINQKAYEWIRTVGGIDESFTVH
jgi:predicted RNA-binding protein with PUA-like domain/rRNA-processing protein FCF1